MNGVDDRLYEIDNGEDEVTDVIKFRRSNLCHIVDSAKCDGADERQSSFAATTRDFERLEKLGEGTYGIVFKARSKRTGKEVAIKKVKITQDDEGIPVTTLREVAVLRRLAHPNIVQLQAMITENNKLYLVFEYVAQDLKQFIREHTTICIDGTQIRTNLTSTQIYEIFYQIVSGVLYCHLKRIIHRDLKPQNILIDKNMNVKIADFGLARLFIVPFKTYTHEIVTLYYRSPEVLLGSSMYSCGVDVWSMGCIFAELFLGKILFPGECEIDQLFKIFQMLGTPDQDSFPGLNDLPYFSVRFPAWAPSINAVLKDSNIDKDGLDCLLGTLKYDSSQRLSALRVRDHKCFDRIDKDKFPKR